MPRIAVSIKAESRYCVSGMTVQNRPEYSVDLNVICKQMGRSPDWMPDILLRADGYETNFYKKD